MNIFKNLKRKVMKITLGFILISLIGLIGCKNPLQEKPYGSVSVDSFYQNQTQAQLALNAVYSELWTGRIYKDMQWVELSDFTGGTLTSYPRGSGTWTDWSWTTTTNTIQEQWVSYYEAINRANTLLDKLAKSKGITGAKSIEGQALFLRALYYFHLVKLFGGVPLYVHGTYDLSKVDKARSSAGDIYKQIESDLQTAYTDMSPYSASDHKAGKATSAAAEALLAKVYAQEQKWSAAASAAKKVMDMGVFSMDKDYANLLDPAYNDNHAIIFSIQHGNGGDPTSNLGEHMVYEFGPAPQTTKSGLHVEFFHVSKGVSAQVTPSFFNSTPNTYRKWQSMRDKMPFYYKLGSSSLVQDTVSLDAAYVVKFFHLNKSTGNLYTGVQFPILRYSDVLLTYAEAENEANNGPNQAAYDAINAVRERARGVGTPYAQPASVYPDLSGLSQSQFRDSVLTEEAREFVGEGHRRWDLLRHNMLISNAKMRGVKGVSSKDKLFPIPEEEISRNPKLKQNPGY